MKLLKNKKIITFASTLMVVSTPIITVVSCTTKSTAESNNLRKMYASHAAVTIVKQQFFQTIINEEAKHNTSLIGFEDGGKASETAWNMYSLSKLRNDSRYWVKQINLLLQNSTLSKKEVEGKDFWENNYDSKTKSDTADYGFFLTYTHAKAIMDAHPTLGWKLEIQKMLLSEILFTTAKSSELATKEETGDKKEGKWFKTNYDTPDFLYRGSKNQKEGLDISKYNENYFFLNQYLLDSHPTFIWEKKQEKYATTLTHTIITNASEFNLVNTHTGNLATPDKIFERNILTTSQSNGLQATLKQLYGFKGIGTPMVNEGESSTDLDALKKRLKDNTSELGFLSKNGTIDTQSGAIFKDSVATAQIIQQFLPFFIGANDHSKNLERISDKDKVWVVNPNTGNVTLTDIKKAVGKIIIKENNTSSTAASKAGWSQFKYVNGKITKAWMDSHKQKISNVDELSLVQKDKSFFYAETNLLKDKDNLRKLIYQLVLHDSSIFQKTKKYMTTVRGYTLVISDKAQELKDALAGEVYIK